MAWESLPLSRVANAKGRALPCPAPLLRKDLHLFEMYYFELMGQLVRQDICFPAQACAWEAIPPHLPLFMPWQVPS